MNAHPYAIVYFPQEVTHFELRGYTPRDHLLLPGQVLAADPDNNWLMVLEDGRYLRGVQFTTSEWMIVLPLLVSYPDYLPYEVAYCAFTYGTVEQGRLEQTHRQLNRALGTSREWDALMRPIRNVMSRTRLKLERKLEVASVRSLLETGFQLCPYRARATEEEEHESESTLSLSQLMARARV